MCKEDRELYLKDGTEKIFYNCAADPEKVPENLRELYDYIRSGKVGGDLSRRMDEAVCIARKNEEWEAVIKSNRTYGEILVFIKGGEAE